jgi:uncharacterized Fe-S radical SAM superfamily protein PflX
VEDPILEETVDMNDVSILECAYPQNWNTGHVMISNVLKGSRVDRYHLFKVGDILANINHEAVHSIPDVVRALKASGPKIIVVMRSGRRAIFNRSHLQKEDISLQKIHNYTNTFTLTDLNK